MTQWLTPTATRSSQQPLLQEHRIDFTNSQDNEQERARRPDLGHSEKSLDCPAGGACYLPQSGWCPGLEGLRGVAILMTAFSHVARPFFLTDPLGFAGVTIFFVLSGFGTMQQLQRIERQVKSGNQGGWFKQLWQLKVDRLKRLEPAIFIMLVAMWILAYCRNPWGGAHPPWDRLTRYSVLAITNTSNIKAFWFNPRDPGPFPNMWSLGPTEQLHLLATIMAPLFFSASRSDQSRRRILFIAMISSWILFFICSLSPKSEIFDPHLNPFCVLYRFAAGALLRYKQPIPSRLYRSLSAYLGLTLITLVVWSWKYSPLAQFRNTIPGWGNVVRSNAVYGDPLIIIGICLIICGCRTTPLPPKKPDTTASSPSTTTVTSVVVKEDPRGANWLLECEILRFCGKVSYPFYLYQDPILVLSGWPRGWAGTSYQLSALVAASVSELVIEPALKPLLFRKKTK